MLLSAFCRRLRVGLSGGAASNYGWMEGIYLRDDGTKTEDELV